MARLIGNEVASIQIPRSLVYMATHDGGDNRLPYRYRSFISFSFGYEEPETRTNPVRIEDFNLIATVDGDRMQRNLTGDFEDLTSTYDVIDGQFYHSTHFLSNSLSFTLSTDGIDSRMMEKFINWFAPGKTRELILSEHPNRAIMARVALPPEMNMLPFEKLVKMTIAGIEYDTSVTNFKGDILLEFIMDDPFWYSIINIFGRVRSLGNGEVTYINEWDGVPFLESTAESRDKLRDVLKIVYEDGTPLYSMIASPMIFGNDVYAVAGGRIISQIVTPITEEEYIENQYNEGYYDNGLKDNESDTIYYEDIDSETGDTIYNLYYKGAVIDTAVIDGAFVTSTLYADLTVESGLENAIKVYYAGTAPAPVHLEFTVPIDVNENLYVNTIASSFVKVNNKTYNTITFESVHKHTICFTTPNLLTSYNKTIERLNDLIGKGKSAEDIRAIMRDEIRHPLIRAGVINLINLKDDSLASFDDLYINEIIAALPYILPSSLTVIIDSKTGVTNGIYHFTGNLDVEENIGDMLSSNYLLLTDRNTFDENMLLLARTEEHKDYSYIVYHDFARALTNVSIQYLNLYY